MPIHIDSIPKMVQSVIEYEENVIVAFCSEECEVCKEMKPIFLSLIKDYDQEVHFVTYKADINTERKLYTSSFEFVNGFPTWGTFKNGVFQDYLTGEQTRDEFVRLLDNLVGKSNE